MHHAPTRAATLTTVAVVLVAVAAAFALLQWGPDPQAVRDVEPDVAGTSAAAVEERRTLTTEQVDEMRAAREAMADDAILRQLRDVAERIARDEPMVSPPPQPADISAGSNRGLGYHLMLEFGFGEEQWPTLDALWRRESGWNHLAENRSSGAYGIPQSLPANKMAVVGADYRSNPETQIRWGLAYIRARYGTPQRAWEHSEKHGWY